MAKRKAKRDTSTSMDAESTREQQSVQSTHAPHSQFLGSFEEDVPPDSHVVTDVANSPLVTRHSPENVPPAGHFVTDSKGIIQLADAAATHLVNRSQRDLLGQPLSDVLGLGDPGAIETRLQQLEDEPGLEWDVVLAPKDRRRFSARLTVSAVRGPSGTVTALHWVIRDGSAREQAATGDQLLRALGEDVLHGRSLTHVLSHVCEQVIRLFPSPFVCVATREAGDVSTCAQAGGSHLTPAQSSHALTAAERRWVESVLETHTTVHLQAEREQTCAPTLPGGFGPYPSRLLLPLGTRHRPLGVLVVSGARRTTFDAVTIQWFETLTRQITVYLALIQRLEHLRVPGAAMASAEHPVFITDTDGRIEWVNDAYMRLTGYPAADLIGTIPQSFKAGKFRSALQQARRSTVQGQCWRYESLGQRKDGRSYMVELVVTPLRNDRGDVTHFVAIHQDITVRKEAEARIFHLAHHDPLTDLPNRTMFYDRLKQAFGQAKRHDRIVGVLFLDLDRFKPINDSLGHEMGDELLKNVADRLTRCVRVTDTVARLSGDEFTIILQDLERGQDAGHVAQKVLEAVTQPMTLGERTIQARISMGIALYPFDATDPDVLIAQADRAMYRAKEKGGQCYQFISDEMNAQAFERLMLEKSLLSAWERRDFFLHYQPEIETRSGRIIEIEALLRWQHAELGMIFPSQLLPLAEAVDCFDEIQEWVLRTACEQRRAWSGQGLRVVPISVNVSRLGEDPMQAVTMVERVLEETGCAPQNLRLEISQSAVRLQRRTVGTIVKKLLDVGVETVLDDVTDEDTLSSWLRRIPFRRVKLASSLACAAPDDPDAVKTVDQCLAIGGTLQVPVVAKGVESSGQLKFLQEHGCHEMQGYLFSRPLPDEEMTTVLDERWALEL